MVKERFMNFGHEIKKNRALFIMVLPAVLPVSYTHLDVYKRQE